MDLGTPALDLTHRIAGLESVILVDSVVSNDSAGAVVLYRKEDILRTAPAPRLDPHSPALSECLMMAEMLGSSPREMLLIGVVGESYQGGDPLSAPVRGAVNAAIACVLEELQRLGIGYRKKEFVLASGDAIVELLSRSF